MRTIKYIIVIVLVSVFCNDTQAQKIRKYSNEFLSIGVGGGNLGMANARVAGTGDLYASYYNPAGLSHITDNFQVGYMHSEYFAGIAKYDYAGVAIPLEKGKRTLAFSFIRFGVDDIPNTLHLFEADGSINYDNVEEFSVGEYGLFLSYGQKLSGKVEGLSIGGSVKVIHKKVGPFATAWGFGLDAGLQYRKKGWRFGFMARDISTTYNAWSFSFTDDEQAVLVQTNNEIPDNSVEITAPRLLVGLGYEFNIKNKFFIEPEMNIDMNVDGRRNVLIRTDPMSFDLNLGLELNYARIVYLRAGLGNFTWQQNTLPQDDGKDEKLLMSPNIGVGLNIKGFHIDYSYTNLGESEAFYSNVISLHFGLNKNKGNKSQSEDVILEAPLQQ
ncbi:MAG: hypothetical protein ACPG4Z_04225 [Chitinophagales bacterium]